MKRLKLLLGFSLVVVLYVSLSGCYDPEITSTSPDPGQIIYLNQGDTQTFSVDVSQFQDLTARGIWSIKKYPYSYVYEKTSNHTKIFQYVATQETNNTTIRFDLEKFEFYTPGMTGNPMLGWHSIDSRVWEVRIIPQEGSLWNGNYFIESNNDLHHLFESGVSEIAGNLSIAHSDDIENLEGLNNLTSIGGGLYVGYNDVLENIEGLNKITSIGESVAISENDVLRNLVGLGNITSIGGRLLIYENDVLTNLVGLDNVTLVGDYLRIFYNDALTNLDGLNRLCSVEGKDERSWLSPSIEITHNKELCTNIAEELKEQILSCDSDGVSGYIDINRNKECP